jgi:hypothetical protein
VQCGLWCQLKGKSIMVSHKRQRDFIPVRRIQSSMGYTVEGTSARTSRNRSEGFRTKKRRGIPCSRPGVLRKGWASLRSLPMLSKDILRQPTRLQNAARCPWSSFSLVELKKGADLGAPRQDPPTKVKIFRVTSIQSTKFTSPITWC